MAGKRYIVTCGETIIASSTSPVEALLAASSCRSTVRLYRAELVAEIDASLLPALLRGLQAETGKPQPRESAAGPTVTPGKPVAVVFDQMYKTFAQILDRELKDKPLVFHEVLGRGIDKPVRVSQRVYQQPAHDDYDVLRLVERLANQHGTVIFFTGDKRLANQARLLPGVNVVYLPPGEVAGKEMALRVMKQKILELLQSEGGR